MVDCQTYPGLGLSTDRGFDCLAQRLASAALVVMGHSFPHAGLAPWHSTISHDSPFSFRVSQLFTR